MDSIKILTVKCSACSRTFQHIEAGGKKMRCPKCKADYVLIDGEWRDKRFEDYLRKRKKGKA